MVSKRDRGLRVRLRTKERALSNSRDRSKSRDASVLAYAPAWGVASHQNRTYRDARGASSGRHSACVVDQFG